jgi:nitrile hydratase
VTAAEPLRSRFRVGDRVQVLHLGKTGHVRIPFYVRGKLGEIVQYCGRYLNPEDLAVGRTDGPTIDLYRVRFAQRDLWPADSLPEQDSLVIEIYDHWLAPANLPERPLEEQTKGKRDV